MGLHGGGGTRRDGQDGTGQCGTGRDEKRKEGTARDGTKPISGLHGVPDIESKRTQISFRNRKVVTTKSCGTATHSVTASAHTNTHADGQVVLSHSIQCYIWDTRIYRDAPIYRQ